MSVFLLSLFVFSSRRRHTRCALVTGVQTCALPIYPDHRQEDAPIALGAGDPHQLAAVGAALGGVAEIGCRHVSLSTHRPAAPRSRCRARRYGCSIPPATILHAGIRGAPADRTSVV